MFFVDIPNISKPGEFIPLGEFSKKSEALAFAKTFGADDTGNLSLISNVGDYIAVDIPNPYNPGEFDTVQEFEVIGESEEFNKKALFLAKGYGADESGNISLISET